MVSCGTTNKFFGAFSTLGTPSKTCKLIIDNAITLTSVQIARYRAYDDYLPTPKKYVQYGIAKHCIMGTHVWWFALDLR